jgi:hypothetical protein
VLIDNHVLEGVSRLRRQPPAGSCGRNEVPLEVTTCHAVCPAQSCLEGQKCVRGRCVTPPPSARECAMSLYDVDAIDEGAALYGETESPIPLRLSAWPHLQTRKT